jgi:hypothetical protein
MIHGAGGPDFSVVTEIARESLHQWLEAWLDPPLDALVAGFTVYFYHFI